MSRGPIGGSKVKQLRRDSSIGRLEQHGPRPSVQEA